MSPPLISHNPDLARLAADGYEVAIRHGHLVISGVPYVNIRKEIRLGTLVSDLSGISGDITVSPVPQHTAGMPDWQLSPIVVSHVVPHVPQFASSVCVSLHEPLQQVSLEPHAFVHEPQCASSLDMSTHVPLQFVCPVGQHVVRPLFVWQLAPVPQSFVHEPQCVSSVVRSTHVPLQFV